MLCVLCVLCVHTHTIIYITQSKANLFVYFKKKKKDCEKKMSEKFRPRDPKGIITTICIYIYIYTYVCMYVCDVALFELSDSITWEEAQETV